MTSTQRMAGLIAACCLAFSPALQASVVVETFTDYNAFLSLLGSSAQVVNFDDVPLTYSRNYGLGYAYLDPNRYAAQGIVIQGGNGVPTVIGFPRSSNEYIVSFAPGASFNDPPGPSRETSYLTFTHNGQPALTSAFGTFFIDDTAPPQYAYLVSLGATGPNGVYGQGTAPLATESNRSTFVGVAAVDSATGELVPEFSEVTISDGQHNFTGPFYMDNFTFATPVPEGEPAVLLGAAALAVVGLGRRRTRVKN